MNCFPCQQVLPILCSLPRSFCDFECDRGSLPSHAFLFCEFQRMTMRVIIGLLASLSLLSLSGADLEQPQSVLSFRGVYGSNFNETITFCYPRPTSFEQSEWHVVEVLARSIDSGQSVYNEKGALLSGGTYILPNRTIVWRGLGFSANGPYDCAFALTPDGKNASGYYTFLPQFNASTPAGETGPWLLYYERDPTAQECGEVLRCLS